MNNTNPGNCMEFLNVRNSYNYNQYVQEAGEIIREFSGEVAHFPSSNIEKERRQTGNQRFIANQLMADCLQQTMPPLKLIQFLIRFKVVMVLIMIWLSRAIQLILVI